MKNNCYLPCQFFENQRSMRMLLFLPYDRSDRTFHSQTKVELSDPVSCPSEESWLYIWLHMYWTHCSIHCMISPIKWNRKRFDPARFLWWDHYCDYLDYHISPDPLVYLDVSAQLCNISGQQGACIGKVNTGLDTCSGYSIFNFWADTW